MYYVDYEKAVVLPRGGGGGVTLIFSSYVGSGPASTDHPMKISGISRTQKRIFAKKYLPFFILTLRKDPKMHRNNP